MPSYSEQALQFMESAAEVESSVDKIGPMVGEYFDHKYGPRFENREDGCQPPRVLDTMIALKEDLTASRERLAAADEEHVELLRQMVETRDEREQLKASLYRHLSAARHVVEDLYGKGKTFQLVSLEGPTGRTSNQLMRQAGQAAKRLGQKGLKLPDPEAEGFGVNPPVAAKALKKKVGRLTQVIDHLRGLRRDAQESRKVKNRVLKEHKALFLNVARALESFYRLAGEDEHADRIRPSARRPGRRVIDDNGQASDDGSSEESPEQASSQSTSESSAETPPAAESAAPEASASESPVSESTSEASTSERST